MKGSKSRPVRRVPQRTCVGCGQTTGKRELVRLVRTLSDEVEVDPTGKRPGRGAYICLQRECWATALKKRAIERSLKVVLTPASRERLESYARTLPGAESRPAEESAM